jgi:hypothetical protein
MQGAPERRHPFAHARETHPGCGRTVRVGGAVVLDQALVRETLWDWDGSHPPLAWDALPDRREHPGARLALLAALAPYRITEEDVTAWRRPEHTDLCLVHLVAYGAFAAVDRTESSFSLHAARETS